MQIWTPDLWSSWNLKKGVLIKQSKAGQYWKTIMQLSIQHRLTFSPICPPKPNRLDWESDYIQHSPDQVPFYQSLICCKEINVTKLFMWGHLFILLIFRVVRPAADVPQLPAFSRNLGRAARQGGSQLAVIPSFIGTSLESCLLDNHIILTWSLRHFLSIWEFLEKSHLKEVVTL